MKLGIVGDLSDRPIERLQTVVEAAFKVCDCVVQLGDLSPAYDYIKERIASSNGRLYIVPGNHDTFYDKIGYPRDWKVALGDLVTFIGIDNSQDRISEDGWRMLYESGPTKYGIVFCHKSPKPIVLPNGQISNHIMGEGQPNEDADRLVKFLKERADTVACGHYHGQSIMDGPWGTPLILEGRGGAADELGFTALTILPEGWSIDKITL